MHIMANYNALYPLIILYNALCMKALSKVLPKKNPIYIDSFNLNFALAEPLICVQSHLRLEWMWRPPSASDNRFHQLMTKTKGPSYLSIQSNGKQ